MLHVTNTFDPPVFPSSSSSAAGSATPSFAFSLRRGWCQSNTVIGSVLLQEGDSVVSAIVHILRPNNGRSVSYDQAVLECNVTFASHIAAGNNSKAQDDEINHTTHVMAKAVEAALLPAVVLESYPKAVISVHVNILQSSAHDTAAAISAASLALVDASVEMRDIVLSVMLRNDDVSVGPVFRCVVAAKTSTQDVSFLDFNGEVDALAMLQIVDGCKAQCTSLRSSVMQEFHQRS